MVNNYEAIKNLMHFEMEGDVYFVQVMQRGKDFGNKKDRVIRDYHIHSFVQFETDFKDMVDMCEKYGARAMIRLNQRNTLDANIQTQIECLSAQLEVNRILRKMIRTCKTTYNFPKLLSAQKFYSSALGKTCSEDSETKKWIIDIDPDMVNTLDPCFQNVEAVADLFERFIVGECGMRDNVPKIYCRLPSKHGIHLVTSTFRKDVFYNRFGKPTNQDDYIMTDANTNLYIPDMKQ